MKDKEYLYVCERCLMAIESREGNLARKIYRPTKRTSRIVLAIGAKKADLTSCIN